MERGIITDAIDTAEVVHCEHKLRTFAEFIWPTYRPSMHFNDDVNSRQDCRLCYTALHYQDYYAPQSGLWRRIAH